MIVRVEEQVGCDDRPCAQEESDLLREMSCAAEKNRCEGRKISPGNGSAEERVADPVKGGGEHK